MTFPGGGEQVSPELNTQDDPQLEGAELHPDNQEDGGDDEEHFVGFADEEEADETEQTPLVKRLREQIRTLSRNQQRREPSNDADPEPQVPDEPNIDDFGYDVDAYKVADREYREKFKAHAQWEIRQATRKQETERAQSDIQRRVEQQKSALKVNDFDEKANLVKERLSDAQLNALLRAADNSAALIYALGRSQTKLDMLAGETDEYKYVALVGKLEKDVKMGKKSPPPPMERVRGGDASFTAPSSDKELERLEKEAERTGDRTKVIQYKRQLRAA